MINIIPIAYVRNNRIEIKDDYWGGIESRIEMSDEIPEEALIGLEEFSHLEIIFHFNKLENISFDYGPLHPRGNTKWPEVGLYATRKKRRPNLLGATIVKLLKVDGKTLIVEKLDADDGTPVIDIKPVLKEFLPHDNVTQPDWATDLMKNYWLETKTN